MTRFCPNCEEYRETKTVKRRETYEVRGRKITVTVHVEVCQRCGDGIGSDAHDQKVLDALHAEYRKQVGMLTPEQIRGIRERYRLSQKSFAALLGMSEATINRYESGALQERTHDNLIRMCENVEVVRDLLQRHGHKLTAWQRHRTEEVMTRLQNEKGLPVPDEDKRCYRKRKALSKSIFQTLSSISPPRQR